MLPTFLSDHSQSNPLVSMKRNKITCNSKTVPIEKLVLKHKLLKFFLQQKNEYVSKSTIIRHLYNVKNLKARSPSQQNAYFQAARKQLERTRRFMELNFDDVTAKKYRWIVYNRKINAWKLYQEVDPLLTKNLLMDKTEQ